MREITRSVKVALKCLIAVVLVDVDLQYWTLKVEHIVAFTAIFSNICTAHAQKRLLMNIRCKVRHHRSIRRPRFPIRVQNFGDVATFSVELHLIFWMSAIFLLPVCMTYWPRKYTTRVDPHVDNSHQFWSWYDHTLPSYSVFVCWYVRWPWDLDLWPYNLEQLLCMAGHVPNLATKFDDPTPIRRNGYLWTAFLSADTSRDLVTLTFDLLAVNSCLTWRVTWPTLPPSLKTLGLFVHELRVITFPFDYHKKCARGHCACAESRDPWVGGQIQLHIWNPRPRFAYSVYNFYWATVTKVRFRSWQCEFFERTKAPLC